MTFLDIPSQMQEMSKTSQECYQLSGHSLTFHDIPGHYDWNGKEYPRLARNAINLQGILGQSMTCLDIPSQMQGMSKTSQECYQLTEHSLTFHEIPGHSEWNGNEYPRLARNAINLQGIPQHSWLFQVECPRLARNVMD